jgi:anti-sigma-K factor RskA
MKKIAECRQEEDWALYALGALDPDDAAQMRAHLETRCENCLQSYRDALTVMDGLAATVPQLDPSPDVAEKLLARISPASSPKVIPMGSRWPHALPWLAAAACALLACWLGVQWHRTSQMLEEAQGHSDAKIGLAAAQSPSNEPVERTAPQHPQEHSAPQPAEGREPELLKAEVRALNVQLSALQTEQQAAAARATEAGNELARARQERDDLRAQLSTTEDKLRAETSAHTADAHDARVDALNQELQTANGEIAELKSQATRSSQLLAFLDSGPVQQIQLRGIDAAADKASAVAFYAPGRGLLMLAHKLPQLKQDKCYQLWSIHKAGQAITSVGLLRIDSMGEGYLYTSSAQSLQQLSALAITDEPKGGSISAQGRKLLFGSLN